jgi:hypothetical protein
LSSNGAKFSILYYKQFLGKSCSTRIEKNCWLGDNYVIRIDLKFKNL